MQVQCGDGFRETSGEVFTTAEACDDGNDRNDDGCSRSLSLGLF